MNERNLMPLTYVATFILFFLGVYMKLNHITGSSIALLFGITANIIFLTLTIKEISNSRSIKSNDKTIWYIALIMATTIAGLFYILSARKNITNQNKLTQN